MARIGLIGYGKMGKIIEQKAIERGHNITAIIDPQQKTKNFHTGLTNKAIDLADIFIDFSSKEVVLENIAKISAKGKKIVVGTTGWYDFLPEAKQIVEGTNGACIWSGNFSIGVNLFFKTIENASKIIGQTNNYDAAIIEQHHNKKADAPSGTAKMIGEKIIKNFSKKQRIAEGNINRPIEDNEINISSLRVGSVIGKHEVIFDSNEDTITIEHNAKNRNGFALGAVLAAEFISDKKGFFGIDDLMNNIIGG